MIYECLESLLLTALHENIDQLEDHISDIRKNYNEDIDIHHLPNQLRLVRTILEKILAVSTTF